MRQLVCVENGVNLLQNGDFQAPYTFPSEGQEDVVLVQGANRILWRWVGFRVPTYFTGYAFDDSVYRTVEMGLGETSERLFEGHPSVMWFYPGAPYRAGLMQLLPGLMPGRYVLDADVSGWLNHGIPGTEEGGRYRWCFGDGLCTIGVGRGEYFYPEGEIPPPEPWRDAGDEDKAWLDAPTDMVFRCGVDTDFHEFVDESQIVWGRGCHSYNTFHKTMPFTFEIRQFSDVMVYLESTTRWGFNNHNSYAGGMSLVRIGDPSAGTIRRWNYKAHLIPQDSTPEEISAVGSLADLDNSTICFSADHALMGDSHPNVIDARVVVWDVERTAGDQTSLQEFARENYPPEPIWEWRRLSELLEPTPEPDPEPEPEPEPPVPDPSPWDAGPAFTTMNQFSLHVQGDYVDGSGYGIMEWIRDVQPGAIKFVDAVERARGAKAVSPNTITVGRFFRSHQNHYWEGNPEAGAIAYMDEIEDTLRNLPELDVVEGLNEMMKSGAPWEAEKIVRWEVQFCKEFKKRGLSQVPCVCTLAVGNPFHQKESPHYESWGGRTDIEMMLPSVEAAIQANGYLGPHVYYPVRDGVSDWENDWFHYAGRPLLSWDPVFTANGLYPRYLFGEGGAVRCEGENTLQPLDGWKACYNFEMAMAGMAVFLDRKLEWNLRNDFRAGPVMAFTFEGGAKWKEFEYREVFKRIAQEYY